MVYNNQKAERFNYNWTSYIGGKDKTDEELSSGKTNYTIDTSVLELTTDENGKVNGAALRSIVKNEYTPITHTMKKKWIDDNDYYLSRGNTYQYHLQRYLEGVDDVDIWKDLNVDPAVTDLSKFPQEYTEPEYRELGGKNFTEYSSDYDVVKASMSVNNADTHQVMSGHDNNSYQEHLFEKLPLYDLQGRKYHYRVVEDKIGDNLVEEHTYQFEVIEKEGDTDVVKFIEEKSFGTNNYYVGDGRSDGAVTDSETVTNITNELVTPKDFLHIDAVKIWDDNNNQDSIRPNKVYFRLTQTYYTEVNEEDQGTAGNTGDEENHGNTGDNENGTQRQAHTTYSYKYAACEKADDSDRWSVRWDQCPAFTKDGKLYHYTVDEVLKIADNGNDSDYMVVCYTNEEDHGEDTDIPGYEATFLPIEKKKETENGTDIEVRVEPFRNKHIPENQDLTVRKVWDDSDNENGLRPAKVKYELYCKYPLYTADSDHKAKPVTDESGNQKYEIK